MNTNGCALCNERVQKTNLLSEFDDWFITFNRYPYLPGHLLLMPKQEVPILSDCSIKTQQSFGEILSVCQKVLIDCINYESCNIGINTGPQSGASIPEHLHVHLVPRKVNDFNFLMTCAEHNGESLIPRENIQFFDYYGKIRNKIINAFVDNIDERLSAIQGYIPNAKVKRSSSEQWHD